MLGLHIKAKKRQNIIMKSSLGKHQLVTREDIDFENKALQRKIQKEGGAYFLKSDLEKMNFVLKLEVESAMRKICEND